MTITLPIRLHNPLNNRQHWRTVWGRGQKEKQVAAAYLRVAGNLPPLPVTVNLTRVGKRKMDTDGLAASFKHVRDSIAKAYGRDDGEACFRWQYDQRTGKEYAAEVTIVAAGAARGGG